MKLHEIIASLEKAGQFLRKWTTARRNWSGTDSALIWFSELVEKQHALNNWHSVEDLTAMLDHLGRLLSYENLNGWISRYPRLQTIVSPSSPVLVKPNVNYSFAGIHEWLCCMVTQSPFVLTASENQFQILKFLCERLTDENPGFQELMDIRPDNILKCRRYIISAGKMNDSMMQYFSQKRAIITEPRNTVGIITGSETKKELENLGKDIFIHQGQTPRSLRKMYIPQNFSINKVIDALEPFSGIYRNNKYANNYDYHQSVFLMNKVQFLDNGFLIFKEDSSDEAPTGCLYYEHYASMETLLNKINRTSSVENIVSAGEMPVKTIKPGESHFFNLWDYFNGKDLVQFLLE